MAMLGVGFVLATRIIVILLYRLRVFPLFFFRYVIKAISTIYELRAAHALSDLFFFGSSGRG